MNNKKYYISTVTIRNGEYETPTNYCFTAKDYDSAEMEVINAFDIGGETGEQASELDSLEEVTVEEYTILNRYL